MTNTTSSKPNLVDSFEEGRLTEWISAHGKNIVYGLITIFLLLVILYRFSSNYGAKQEQDFLQISQDFSIFASTSASQDPAAGTDALERLENAMSKHPELHAAYDGAIAQILLNRELVKQATPYVKATLARTKSDNLPFYADFSNTTLLIGEGQYQQALQDAQALQQDMIKAINTADATERGFGDELFAFNLFRIGMLQQQTGDAKGELQTWQEWKQYAGLDKAKALAAKVDAQAFRNVIQKTAIGSFSLPDYIAYRESVLKKAN